MGLYIWIGISPAKRLGRKLTETMNSFLAEDLSEEPILKYVRINEVRASEDLKKFTVLYQLASSKEMKEVVESVLRKKMEIITRVRKNDAK